MNIGNISTGYNPYQWHNEQNVANADTNAIANENDPAQTAITSTENSQNSGNATRDSKNQNDEKVNEKGEAVNANGLSISEQQLVSELQATDTHVRAHEAAHKAAGGGLAGAASYSYKRGPDNKMYAVAGEVSISMGGGDTPEERLTRAQQVRRAALAPSDPSPQDLKIASQAMSMEMNARMQIAEQRQAELNTNETGDKKDNKQDGESKFRISPAQDAQS